MKTWVMILIVGGLVTWFVSRTEAMYAWIAGIITALLAYNSYPR